MRLKGFKSNTDPSTKRTSFEVFVGTASPEGSVTARPGDYYLRTDPGEIWVKKNGTGNNGWGSLGPDFKSQDLVTTGTVTAGSFIPTSSTAPSNGLYLRTSNRPAIAANGARAVEFFTSASTGGMLLASSSGGQTSIQNTANDGSLAISGAGGAATGRNILLYGSTHSTLADLFQIRAGSTVHAEIDDSGNVSLPAGSLTVSGQIFAQDGTAAAPALAFSSEPTLGFRRRSSRRVELTASSGDELIFSLSRDNNNDRQTIRFVTNDVTRHNITLATSGDDVNFISTSSGGRNAGWRFINNAVDSDVTNPVFRIRNTGQIDLGHSGFTGTHQARGNLSIGNNLTVSGQILPQNGTVSAPAIAWDTNTGIYRSASDQIDITNNGVASARFAPNGLFRTRPGISVVSIGNPDIAAVLASPKNTISFTGYGSFDANALIYDTTAPDVGTGPVLMFGGHYISSNSQAMGSINYRRVFAAGNSSISNKSEFAIRVATGNTGGSLKDAIKVTAGSGNNNYRTIIYYDNETSVGLQVDENGNVEVPNGSLTVTGQILPQNGTAAAPAIAWDTNTGIYRSATNEVALSNNGVQSLRVSADGFLYAKKNTVSIANNQSSAADVTGLVFSSSNEIAARVFLRIRRSTSDFNLLETFELSVVHDGTAWRIEYSSHHDDSGVDFTITGGGQVQYTSTNLSGTGYSGSLDSINIERISA